MRLKPISFSVKKIKALIELPDIFPERQKWMKTLKDFAYAEHYWHIPKVCSLSQEQVEFISGKLAVLEEHQDDRWDMDSQKKVYDKLIRRKLIDPYIGQAKQELGSFTALVRVNLKILQYLGLAWVEDNGVTITDAGAALIFAKGPRKNRIIAEQLLKFQFPDFELNPCVFIAKLLPLIDFRISKEEWVLFLNLATGMEHVAPVAKTILYWRALSPVQQGLLQKKFEALPRVISDERDLFGKVTAAGAPRFDTVAREYSYQRGFLTFPFLEYLDHD